MKKQLFINLFLSGLITTQIVTIPHIVKASPLNFTPTNNFLSAQNTSGLTTERIESVMATIEKAEKEEDINTLLSFLAPYIISNVTIESDDTTIIRSVKGKEEHKFFFSNSFERIKNREYINSYSSIKVTEDGQMAVVTRIRGTNLFGENGDKYLSVSTDKIYFALIDNQPRIVNLEVKGWLEKQP